MTVFGKMCWVWRAIKPKSGFIVDPGGYCPATARLKRGLSSDFRSAEYFS